MFQFLALLCLFSTGASLGLGQTLAPYPSRSLELVLKKRLWGPGNNRGVLPAFSLFEIPLNGETAPKLVESYNGDVLAPWASVSKMLSLHYALSILGGDYTFKTHVYIRGVIKDGILRGDILLQGTGDPSLNTDGLMNLALALQARGIKQVTGGLKVEIGNFFETPELAQFGNGDQAYNQSIGPLNLYFNRLQIARENKSFRSIPELPHFQMNPGELSEAFLPGQRFLFVANNMQKEAWQYNPKGKFTALDELPIKYPSRFAGEVFLDLIRALAIKMPDGSVAQLVNTQKKNEGSAGDWKLVSSHESLYARELARLAMEYSNNLYTECLLLKAAQIAQGPEKDPSDPKSNENPPRNLKDSASAMLEWQKSRYSKLPWGASQMLNGSGLSSENKLPSDLYASWVAMSARDHLENKISTSKELSQQTFFMGLLPMAGQNSWLRERWNSRTFAHRLWAKTGTLDFVTSMAGVFIAKSGKIYAFALSASHPDKRSRLDRFEPVSPKEANVFKGDAKRLFVDVMQEWYDRF